MSLVLKKADSLNWKNPDTNECVKINHENLKKIYNKTLQEKSYIKTWVDEQS